MANRIILLLAAMLIVLPVSAQTTATVSGHISAPNTVATTSQTQVIFELTITGGQLCKVSGTTLVMPYFQTFSPQQILAGVTLYRNDAISCGTTTGGSRWKYTIKYGSASPNASVPQSVSCVLNIASSSINLDSTACLNAAPTPVTVTPTDLIYCRLDSSNCGFTGTITAPGGVFSGSVAIGSAAKLTETSAPTCALGFDFIWGDSVAHREKVCDNNGSLVQLIHSGADINTTDQVTVTHLAAALPVLQGGTGVTTAQGNGTKVQLASGGTTTGNFLDYDANGNAIDSGKIAPSGTVVGTTDAQVLTSKILTGVNNGNTVTTPSGCPEQGPTGTLTGNAADQTIYTCTLAGNVLRAGTGIRITTYVNHTTGAGAITYKVNFGGTTYTTTSPTDTAVAAERYSVTLFNNAGVTNAQSGVAEVFSGGAYGIGSLSSSAIDTTAGAAITVTFNAANTQQVQGRIFFVELLQ